MANVTYSAGIATAYGAAVRGGYTGTYDDFCRQQAEYAESAAAVEQAKEDAEAAASAADTSKTAAAGSASAAATSAGQASTSATNAANSATEANASKNAAATSATEAGNSATAAAGSASDAQNSADDAQASAEAAAQSAASVDVHTDGNYPEMTVGTSEQLLSTQYVEDKTPYLFRTTGGSSDVGNREYVRGITGGTVAWNQLCNGSSATVPSGHKYLSKIGTTWSVAASTGAAITGLTSGSDMVIDLTQMFGTTIADYIYSLEQATAGAGVAFFRKLFPNDYYPYDSGTLKSVEGVSSHEMVGFNQWDEEWEVGSYDTNTGAARADLNQIRSKGFIPVIPSTSYYVRVHTDNSKGGLWIQFYDENKNIIPKATTDNNYNNESNKSLNYFNNVMTLNAECHYIKFYCETRYGTTYNHDICINLAWSGTHNGEYKPYEKHTYALDGSLTLRGIPKLDASNNLYYDGDVYAPDGTVTRKCVETTFTGASGETWQKTNNGSANSDYFMIIIGANGSVIQNSIFSNQYLQTTINSSTKNIGINVFNSSAYNGAVIAIRPANVADITEEQFRAMLSANPVTVVYGISTPTTEEAEPYTEIQICDDWGTEEYVSTSIVPVGHTTDYPANLRDKLQHLPDLASADGNYIVSQSGTQMTLAPLPIVIPAPPTTDGTYTLRATVSNGVPTLSWVEE